MIFLDIFKKKIISNKQKKREKQLITYEFFLYKNIPYLQARQNPKEKSFALMISQFL